MNDTALHILKAYNIKNVRSLHTEPSDTEYGVPFYMPHAFLWASNSVPVQNLP